MAGCGYHPPQFSEDILWLPPWLQPNQLPHFGGHAEDEQPDPLVACKNHASFQENISGGQDDQLFTKDDAKSSSLHLYLSGDDNSPAGKTTSSGQELYFHLHLSSLGISQPSSGHCNEIPQIGRCETNKGSFRKLLTSAIQSNTSCEHNMDKDSLASESRVDCNPRMSQIFISERLDKAGQDHPQFQVILDDSNLRTSDIGVGVLKIEKWDNEGSFRKSINETSSIQNDVSCQDKVGCRESTDVPPVDCRKPSPDMPPVYCRKASPDVPPVECKPRMSHTPVSEPHVNPDQNNRQRCQGKLDGNLKTADLNDAVELSIAASEAMVISEMASTSSLSEALPAASILEIALRVKQARKQCHSNILEAVPVFSDDEYDETDQLSDLDEGIMEEAFDDVGLSVIQVVGTLKNSFCDGKSPQQQILYSTSPCDQNTHVSDSHCEPKKEAHKKQLESQDVDINKTISKTYDVFSDEIRSKNFLLEKVIQNACAPIANHMDSNEDQGMLKESQVALPMEAGIRRTIKGYFNTETSFISESMDIVNGCTVEQRPEVDRETVGSSSTPFKIISRCNYMENKSTHEGIVSSQDVRSSSLSLADPYCSIVPCSISENDPFMEEAEENGDKFINLETAAELRNLHGETTMPNPQEALPAKLLNHGEEFLLSKIFIEGSGVSARKQFNSLKPYSMVTSCQNTAQEIVLQKKSIPLPSMGEKITHSYPTEKSSNYLTFNKDDSRPPFKTIDNSCCRGSKDHENIDGPSATRETKDDDIAVAVHHNENKSLALVLNSKKRSLQNCKLLFSDCEDEGSEGYSALKRCRLENPMDGDRCEDQTNITSCVPQQPTLSSHPAKAIRLLDKRVRFVEAKSSIDRTKTDGSLLTGYQALRSQRRTRKRSKESSLQCKSGIHKRISNSLNNCSRMHGKGMVFQGLEFLLTGYSSKKEKELEAFIRKHGGYVLLNIPSFSPDFRGKRMVEPECSRLPIVLSPKKAQTTKFLYGCATNAWMLHTNWILDSVQAGSVLPPTKYMTRPIQASKWNCLRIAEPFCFNKHTFIFDRVGIMLYGKPVFCSKFFKIIKHGGGQVFKSLQRLVQSLKNGRNTVGAILVENEGNVSRHLRHCAFEHSLQTMPASWIVDSLFSGKLLPFKKDRCAPFHRIKIPTFPRDEDNDMSQEI